MKKKQNERVTSHNKGRRKILYTIESDTIIPFELYDIWEFDRCKNLIRFWRKKWNERRYDIIIPKERGEIERSNTRKKSRIAAPTVWNELKKHYLQIPDQNKWKKPDILARRRYQITMLYIILYKNISILKTFSVF